ncbi:alpha/beta fold hydrolase [Streptomyces sp. NPDC002746]
MKFVMVPGGWHGGWVFDSVAVELDRASHQVEAVTLAGLEPDGPPDADRPPNLDTHIDQVAEVIDRCDGTPLALCGHSYGGMVIAGVADRLGPRLGPFVWIRLGSRALVPHLAALSSINNAPRCLNPPPCDARHQAPLPDPA